jgi:TetR/AcrR family transcriptional regulator
MKHQRAISESEKSERRQEILRTAAALFETCSYDQVNMIDVARQAGIAKGTVYLYFKTKEELFLALLDNAFDHWFTELNQRLVSLPESGIQLRIGSFAAQLTESLNQHGTLLKLLPILHTVLEHNIPFAAALQFKQHLHDHLLQTGMQIERVLPFLRTGQGGQLLLHSYAALIGLQSMVQPSDVVLQVLERPEMSMLVIERDTALQEMVRRLLTGIWIENGR